MRIFRLLMLISLLSIGAGLLFFLYQKQIKTPLRSTLAPTFQVLGKSVKAIDRALGKAMPIDEIDEQKYGAAIAYRYHYKTNSNPIEQTYLNQLLQTITPYAKKKFPYQVHIMSSNVPNAFALPGGIIMVTTGLLTIMDSETELVSVLAHEMGHIERNHCLDAIKYELTMKKIKAPSLGELVDIANSLLLRHSFSKTQENDADEYAYALLQQTQYDPIGVGQAFERLHAFQHQHSYQKEAKEANVFRDYFMSHPPLSLRKEKFLERAKAWWKVNTTQKRYIGKKNLQQRIPFSQQAFAEEWNTWEE